MLLNNSVLTKKCQLFHSQHTINSWAEQHSGNSSKSHWQLGWDTIKTFLLKQLFVSRPDLMEREVAFCFWFAVNCKFEISRNVLTIFLYQISWLCFIPKLCYLGLIPICWFGELLRLLQWAFRYPCVDPLGGRFNSEWPSPASALCQCCVMQRTGCSLELLVTAIS